MFAQVDRLASEITYVGVGALRVKASLNPMGERAGGGGGGLGAFKRLSTERRLDTSQIRLLRKKEKEEALKEELSDKSEAG